MWTRGPRQLRGEGGHEGVGIAGVQQQHQGMQLLVPLHHLQQPVGQRTGLAARAMPTNGRNHNRQKMGARVDRQPQRKRNRQLMESKRGENNAISNTDGNATAQRT